MHILLVPNWNLHLMIVNKVEQLIVVLTALELDVT